METKHHAMKNQWVKEEIKKEIKKYLKANDYKDTSTQNLWDVAKAQREIHINTGLPQKRKKNLRKKISK